MMITTVTVRDLKASRFSFMEMARRLGFYNAMPVFRRDKSVAYKCSASFKTGI